MAKNDQAQQGGQKQPGKGPVAQQFATGGSAVATPELPYDVEKVHGSKVKPVPKTEES